MPIVGASDLLGLEDHLSWIRDLLQRQSFVQHQQREYERQLNLILRREQDPSLYLGLVGEFSSGKSTFINALLHDPLMPTKVLPGTTAAPTLFRFGERLHVRAYRNQDEVISRSDLPHLMSSTPQSWRMGNLRSGQDPNAMSEREYLAHVTSEENVARDLDRVEVTHAAQVLRPGLVLVDLPGGNTEYERQTQTTVDWLRERCDAAIVTIPATQPLSASLRKFLHEHLADVLHRCVFVVTMMDRVRPQEHAELLEYIAHTLREEFKLARAHVWPAASLVALTAFLEGNDAIPENQHEYVARFTQLEDELVRIAQQSRTIVQAERVSQLLERLMKNLDDSLAPREVEYQARHAELEQNRIPDLASFINQEKQTTLGDFRSATRQLHTRSREAVEEVRSLNVKYACGRVNDAKDESQLVSILRSSIPSGLEAIPNELAERLAPIHQDLKRFFTGVQGQFRDRFTTVYQKVANLAVGHHLQAVASLPPLGTIGAGIGDAAVNIGESINVRLRGPFAEFAQSIDHDLGQFAQSIEQAFRKAWNWLTGDNSRLHELQRNARSDLTSALDKHFREVERQMTQMMTEAIASGETELNRMIDQHFSTYQSLVNDLVQADHEALEKLQHLRQVVQSDRRTIQQRRAQIETVRQQLRQRDA